MQWLGSEAIREYPHKRNKPTLPLLGDLACLQKASKHWVNGINTIAQQRKQSTRTGPSKHAMGYSMVVVSHLTTLLAHCLDIIQIYISAVESNRIEIGLLNFCQAALE